MSLVATYKWEIHVSGLHIECVLNMGPRSSPLYYVLYVYVFMLVQWCINCCLDLLFYKTEM